MEMSWSEQQSSKFALRAILNDTSAKETLLSPKRASGANKQSSKEIEFDSLKFGESEETARLRSLNLISKFAPSSNNQPTGRIAYKNINLWSPRSASLEQLLKPLVVCSVDSWPDYEALNMVADISDNSADVLNKLHLGVVDTLIVRLQEATEVRYGLDHICSPWSYSSEKFELTKVHFIANFTSA